MYRIRRLVYSVHPGLLGELKRVTRLTPTPAARRIEAYRDLLKASPRGSPLTFFFLYLTDQGLPFIG